jgi:hypothetical protein
MPSPFGVHLTRSLPTIQQNDGDRRGFGVTDLCDAATSTDSWALLIANSMPGARARDGSGGGGDNRQQGMTGEHHRVFRERISRAIRNRILAAVTD